MNKSKQIIDPIGNNQDKYSSEFEEICILIHNKSSNNCTKDEIKKVQIEYNRLYL